MARSRCAVRQATAPPWQPPCPSRIDRSARMTIRVVLVDDHAIVRTGLKAVLGAADDIDIVGEAAGGNEAIVLTGRIPADVVVMDLSMADGDGLAATRAITSRPDSRTRVLVLTMHS